MKSVLLAVGCDHYAHLSTLSGAEADARKVFGALTITGQPYAPSDSQLLLSPTKLEFEQALTRIYGPLEVLTLYFAGHGEAKEGGYYFCLRDSRADLLSVTGYALNNWLNLVKELRPRYAYLISDSCFAGGSHHDIRDLLNDPRLGKSSASTFACLAAASTEQYAVEMNGAGLMTAELLKVFDGRLKIGSEQAELDLTDVARAVGQQLKTRGVEQRPVAWGLNLFGPGRLCRNPHFARSTGGFHIPEIAADSVLASRLAAQAEMLWDFYRSASQGLDAELARKIIGDLTHGEVTAVDRAVLVHSLADAFVARMEPRQAPWEEAEALGLFATTLLSTVRTDATAARVARQLLLRKTTLELELVSLTAQRLAADPLHFLNPLHGMGDFFYLPCRLTKFLATVVQAISTAEALGLSPNIAEARALVGQVLSAYPLAFRAVTDDQASALYIWSVHAHRLGWQAELEQVFGSLLTDFLSIRGKVARCGLKPAQACEYILARGKDSISLKLGWLANPSQFLAVLLLIASESNLDETVDGFLSSADHHRLNFYLPKDYLHFSDAVMEAGVNRTHEIGNDIWTCADFRRLFATDWSRHQAEANFPTGDIEPALVSIAALAYPDRIPLSLQSKTA